MGIKHLYQLISEHAPDAVKNGEIKNQFGRKVAIVSCPCDELRNASTHPSRMLQ